MTIGKSDKELEMTDVERQEMYQSDGKLDTKGHSKKQGRYRCLIHKEVAIFVSNCMCIFKENGLGFFCLNCQEIFCYSC